MQQERVRAPLPVVRYLGAAVSPATGLRPYSGTSCSSRPDLGPQPRPHLRDRRADLGHPACPYEEVVLPLG